jgi:hypothetical protein
MRSCSGNVTHESIELESICIDLGPRHSPGSGAMAQANSQRAIFENRLRRSLETSAREGRTTPERALVENDLRLQLTAVHANEDNLDEATRILTEWSHGGDENEQGSGDEATRQLISRYYMQCYLGVLMGDMAYSEGALAQILALRRQVDYRSTTLFALILLMDVYAESMNVLKAEEMKREMENIIREAEAKIGTNLTQ